MTTSIEEMLNPTKASATEVKAEEVKTETKATETKAEKTEAKAEEVADTSKEKMVPIKVVQEERQKRRALKAENEELKKKLAEKDSSYSYSASKTEDEDDSKSKSGFDYKQDRLIQTVNLVRATRPDAADMLETFDQAVEADETLYFRMLNDSDPGTFAYEYAKAIKNQEKYGTSVEEAFKRGMQEASKKAKEEMYKDIKNKKDIGEKLPKNIANAGVSGTGSETAEWAPKNSKEMWG